MTKEQLTGKYARLRSELAAAYAEPQWSLGRIDRITNELADIQRELTEHCPTAEAARDARARD